MVDPIADLLTRIRNAGMARHASTRAPFSKIKYRILEILKDEGYIENFELDNKDGVKKELVINLRYVDDRNISVHTMRRVSKPGRRVYCRRRGGLRAIGRLPYERVSQHRRQYLQLR